MILGMGGSLGWLMMHFDELERFMLKICEKLKILVLKKTEKLIVDLMIQFEV
jgi:hypothetical protein